MESMTCDNILEPGTWDLQPPPWIDCEDVYISHRSNLIRKDPEHYKHYWPDVPDSLEYVWPPDPTARSI